MVTTSTLSTRFLAAFEPLPRALRIFDDGEVA